MRGKIDHKSKEQKMQRLLERELQIEAELQRHEDNIDLFEEYYLQNSWRTGNIFLGWPICSYNQIAEFINRPRAKKNVKPYIPIEDHEKLFSISSISSKPFAHISKANYLANKELAFQFRPKISKTNTKPKVSMSSSIKTEKMQKMQVQSNIEKQEFEEKNEDQISVGKMQEQPKSEQDNSDSGQQESQSKSSVGIYSQIVEINVQTQNNRYEKRSSLLDSISRDSEDVKYETPKTIKEEEKQTFHIPKEVSFILKDQKRSIFLEQPSISKFQ